MRYWIALVGLLVSSHALAYVDVNRAVDEIQNGVLILDLRSDADFEAGNVHNSLQVDLRVRKLSDEIEPRVIVPQLDRVVQDKNQTIVIYSDTNQHAVDAEEALKREGFLNIVNGGNYDELKAALFTLCQKEYWFC